MRGCASTASAGSTRGTFSIVAADLAAGEGRLRGAIQALLRRLGGAVDGRRWRSRATQAAGAAAYGERALAELLGGVEPEQALQRSRLAGDDGRETRQLAP